MHSVFLSGFVLAAVSVVQAIPLPAEPLVPGPFGHGLEEVSLSSVSPSVTARDILTATPDPDIPHLLDSDTCVPSSTRVCLAVGRRDDPSKVAHLPGDPSLFVASPSITVRDFPASISTSHIKPPGISDPDTCTSLKDYPIIGRHHVARHIPEQDVDTYPGFPENHDKVTPSVTARAPQVLEPGETPRPLHCIGNFCPVNHKRKRGVVEEPGPGEAPISYPCLDGHCFENLHKRQVLEPGETPHPLPCIGDFCPVDH